MATLSELNLYPIKSCGAIALREATMTAAGLMAGSVHDREWMVVDIKGQFLTQRTHPQMALIMPHIKADTLAISMAGMRELEVPLAMPESSNASTIDVQVWDDRIKAYDCGGHAAQWFSDALKTPCRLVRFHQDARRLANPKWTGGVEAPTLFSDGYPVLVISEASLEDLNHKLIRQGRSALPMNRFRPNVVIGGTDAFEEDYAEIITIGGIVLKPVKPCPRCPIPSVDQSTGEFGPDPLDILRTYRANPRVDGGITFGMNAIVQEGSGLQMQVGQQADIVLAF